MVSDIEKSLNYAFRNAFQAINGDPSYYIEMNNKTYLIAVNLFQVEPTECEALTARFMGNNIYINDRMPDGRIRICKDFIYE